MPIATNRSLGGIGAILSLLGVISTVTTVIEYGLITNSSESAAARFGSLFYTGGLGLVTFAGFILFLVAMYGFSKDYCEPKIFKNLIYGIVGALATGITVGIVWFVLVIASVFSTGLTSPPTSDAILQYTAPLMATVSVASLVWVFFVMKSYNLLGDKSEVPLFRTGAGILLVSAVLNIVMGAVFAVLVYYGSIDSGSYVLMAVPGGLISYVAQGVFAVAFFRIKVPPTQPIAQYSAPVTSTQVKYCTHCGTANQPDSAYCTRCGQKL